MSGSHLDTQPTGGKYDGVLGVLGALEAVRSMNDLGIRTKHPIVVTNWTNEEGARFAPAMLASGVFAGVIDQDYAYARTDPDGKTFGAELERIGWKGDEPVGGRKMHAYFELHIEQGPILEAEGKEIGVVTHCQGLWWLEFTLTGKEAHTGSTPMELRVNAGLAMARIMEMVQAVAMEAQPDAVGGVGQVRFHPNSRNVLPGKVVFTVDIRSPDQAKLDGMRARIEREAAAICEALGVACAVEPVGHFDPVTFAPELVARVRGAAERLGYSHRDIDLRGGARRLLGGEGGAGDDGDVPLRRRAQPQRGGGDHAGLGGEGRRTCSSMRWWRRRGSSSDCGCVPPGACPGQRPTRPADVRRVSRFAAFEVRFGSDELRLEEFEADFGEPAGGEVLVDYEGSRANIHVLGQREIADGSLTCSIDGARRAMVAADLSFLRRVLAEAPAAAPGEDPDADLSDLSHRRCWRSRGRCVPPSVPIATRAGTICAGIIRTCGSSCRIRRRGARWCRTGRNSCEGAYCTGRRSTASSARRREQEGSTKS